jgi:predicted acylesterase/phospholipase RssA
MKKKSDIKYLSFEGGGGKGNAYVGAVASLEQQGILKFVNNKLVGSVKGISGASAGAITAFFLGSGFSYKELYKTMSANDFNKFFDAPVVGENVIAGKGFSYFDLQEGQKKVKDAPTWLKMLLGGLSNTGVIKQQITTHLYNDNPVLAEKLIASLNTYINCLIADWGLFSGTTIQERFFESLLQYKIYCVQNNIVVDPDDVDQFLTISQIAIKKILTEGFKPCTFKEHFDIFGIELAFTSVNFRTENVQVFSYKTAPDFPITTAVRMSMSLPLIFKPVIINKESVRRLNLTSDFEGYWVDGGLFDNAPARVFNDVAHTILFRLGNRKANNQIDGLIGFIKTYLKIGIMGSGSGQVNTTTVPDLDVVELDVTDLSLLKFNIPTQDFINLANTNKQIVDDYFKYWQP